MNKRKVLIWYITLATIYICSVLANLFTPIWFEYCFWKFGLVNAYSFTDIEDFNEDKSIVSVQGSACGSLKDLISGYCDGVCSHVDNFRIGGFILICFAAASCISALICIFFHVRILTDNSLKLNSISLFIFFPFLMLTAGLAIYVSLSEFLKLNNEGSFSGKSRKFSMDIGMYFAIFNYALCFLVSIFGFFKSRKVIIGKSS